jgi:actin-related protein
VELTGNFQGVGVTLADAVCAVDVDARRTVASEIVVCGGSTAFAKFPDRLQRSLDTTIFPKVKITAMPSAIDRISASWLGCSISCSLATFQHQWISKSQYYEHGADRLVDKLVLY